MKKYTNPSHVVATEYSRGCKPTVATTPRHRAPQGRHGMGACVAPGGAQVGVWGAVRGLTPTANYGVAPSGLNNRVGILTVGLHPRLFSIVPDGDCFRPANRHHRRGESSFALSYRSHRRGESSFALAYRSHVVATEYSRGRQPTESSGGGHTPPSACGGHPL